MQFVTNGLYHTMSSVMVFQSNEYGKFKMINGNRELNETKIKRIIRDINHGIDVLKYYPIQVVEKGDRLEIYDGQHRFYISKKLKKPVHYILMKEVRELSDIAKINSNTEKWKTKDFINCYIQQGNKNYEQLRDFMDKYGFSATVSIKLLQSGSPGTEAGLLRGSDEFQRGHFEVNYLEEATKMAEQVYRFKAFANFKERGFIIAISRVLQAGKINIDDLVEKFEKFPDMLTKQGGFKEYLFNLEMLMNKGKQIRVSIY